jgi:integrase
MGDCGLHVTEVLGVTPSNISRMDDGRHYELEITNGKDTTGSYRGGKQRETWLPVEIEATINRYIRETALRDDDRRVSTHDLRRCWANHLLVEENVSPRIVMALGGWSSYDAIELSKCCHTQPTVVVTYVIRLN